MIALVSQKAGIVFSACFNRLLNCFRNLRTLFHSTANSPEPFLIQLLCRNCHMPGCHQRKLLQIPVFTMQRDDFGDRHIAVTDDKLFAGPHAMEE